MCGCLKHHDKSAECTCICEQHQNFAYARDLAMERYEEVLKLKRENVGLRRKLDSAVDVGDKAPDRDKIGAFMGYDQQGVALFFGGRNVLIIQDDETTAGNAIELTDIQRAVLSARLREISRLIETGQLS